jgi:hypothetical protein
MQVGEYNIPEGWESMSCFYNCGFLMVWEIGSPQSLSAGTVMEAHLEGHKGTPLSFLDWFRDWKGRQ